LDAKFPEKKQSTGGEREREREREREEKEKKEKKIRDNVIV
jgi:hypothetical protein